MYRKGDPDLPEKRKINEEGDDFLEYIKMHQQRKNGHYIGDRCWNALSQFLRYERNLRLLRDKFKDPIENQTSLIKIINN